MITHSGLSNSVTFETVEGLLTIADEQALKSFLCQYACDHPEFKKALLQLLAPRQSTTDHPIDYCEKIEECFITSPKRNRSYGRYSDYEEVDLYEIGEKLDVYLKKAEFLLAQKSFEDVSTIALQTLRTIAEHYDEDQYYSEYGDCFDLSAECEMAGDLLRELAKNAEAAQSLKENILNELCEIAKLDAYSDYCIYEIDELVKDFNLTSQTKEGALKLIDKMLSEADRSSYKTCDLVRQKIELLNELNRNQEAEKTIEEYIAEPRIRKIKIDNLLAKQDYKAAIQCIDEGINIAQQMSHPGTVSDWMGNKLEIYQQANDIPQVIFVAQELFKNNRGSMEYYHLLKKYVPKENWKPFLEKLMQNTALSTRAFLGSSTAADIYVAEKDEKRLLDLLKATSPYEQLGMLLEYGHYLKQNDSAELLDLYTMRLKEYAERNMGRNHYEYVARVLTAMNGLHDGKKAVVELVTLFRTLYKRRPAMMELIRNF